jgi:hypothetical protein
MHTVIRSYRLDEGDLDEAIHRVDASFADSLSHQPGFCAYECLKTGPDGLITITTFRDEDGCARSTELAAAFVRDELSDMKLSRVDAQTGAVMVNRAAREVLEPAHA